MIDYDRAVWYGLHYLLYFRGTVTLRLIPPLVISAVISALVTGNVEPFDWCPDESILDHDRLFSHPFVLSSVTAVIGYMAVGRVNYSYTRYNEGVSHIKMMHSKWSDALIQIVAFDRIEDSSNALSNEPICEHNELLFHQLSALATMYLKGEPLHPKAVSAGRTVEKQVVLAATSAPSPNQAQEQRQVHANGEHSPEPSIGHRRRGITGVTLGHMRHVAARRGLKDLHDVFSEEERFFLAQSPDAIHTQIARISRAITTRHHAGGIRAPAPIVSRVFQEISNGALAFNAATKLTEVPVPFILVHVHMLTLLLLTFMAPLILSCYIGHVVMSILISWMVVGGFYALWLVANELENPFCNQLNAMPLLEYHDHFVLAIESTLTLPWMARDQWEVKEGPWKQPESMPQPRPGQMLKA